MSTPNDEASELLAIFQTRLGAHRSACDEPGRQLWDRIERARESLGNMPPASALTISGALARELADAVLAELGLLREDGSGWTREDLDRVQRTLLPRIYGCLNLHAIAHGYGWEFVTERRPIPAQPPCVAAGPAIPARPACGKAMA